MTGSMHGNGSIRLGTWLMLFHGGDILERLSDAGLRFVRLDMEHTPIDDIEVSQLVARAESLPIDVCVRPASSRPVDIIRALNTGARRIYVPQVETAETAESVVSVARATSPQPVHVSVMLESREAFRNCDAIAAVAGVDMLAIGPADLAQDLGIYGSPDEEEVIDGYRYRLRDAANRHGKLWELGVWSEAGMRRWQGEGCPVLTVMTDTSAFRARLEPALAVMATVRNAVDHGTPIRFRAD